MPQVENVLEPWAIYDTIIICPNLYGTESSVPGWFTTMAGFAARDRHTFFKGRNEANCGIAYCNMQTQDKLDFAFHCFSIGLRFFGACSMIEEIVVDGTNQMQLSPFFMYDIPLHSGVDFKVGQDSKLEANSYMMPPGYGPYAIGIGNGKDAYTGATLGLPIALQVGTQSAARKKNRYHFDTPIPIPRNEVIEATLYLSEVLTRFMANMGGPGFNSSAYFDAGLQKESYYTRYGIQLSLYGVREVQQRGQLHV